MLVKRFCGFGIVRLNRKYSDCLITHINRGVQSIASTIFALSTNIKSSGSAIAVIRVSGSETLNVIDLITNGNSSIHKRNPRKAFLHDYLDPKTNQLIDNGMILWFPKPKSYTGEDLAEFHVHGSHAVIRKMLSVLSEIRGLRPAVQGEFTKRALINGKLELVQAEGIRDLIDAQTDNQRRRALSGLYGNLNKIFNDWRFEIIKIVAHLEALIDFSDEELLDSDLENNIFEKIEIISGKICHYLHKTKLKSDLVKDGFQIAIIGSPNVGKSSLINRLGERNVSITSPISGTTRDIIEIWLDICGNKVCIADTAGIKEISSTDDIIELQGIEKAIQKAKDCQMILMVIDAVETFQAKTLSLPNYLEAIIADRIADELIFVINKIDLLNQNERYELEKIIETSSYLQNPKFKLSCLSNEGFENFVENLKTRIENVCFEKDSEIPFSNDRHLLHLNNCLKELNVAKKSIRFDSAIGAAHLRQASYHLACLTGTITTEDILDVIFKDFCIGK
ncbi:tRNA modification GTPase GTPBP3 [Sarcoptes scabiei]|uniref:tRNA modification GTPase GTPBP3, mitochondrial n=1 Tax=Sarcoptes scabiei TaxID=52283 RepID=A0A834R9X1_SARSC|nr:tRNA modification GTPase GTPBP3 [Sarcoptes scabiei]